MRFDVLTNVEAVEQILMWIEERSRRMVITAGPEFVMMTKRDDELRRIAHVADLVTPDGIGVVWAARRQGVQVAERVTGVELVHQLLRTASDRKQPLRVFMLGATDESLSRALEALHAEYPMHTFAGRNGYFQSEDTAAILAEVEAFSPQVWLVGLGQPRQERFIYNALGKLPGCVAIGVGGSIDVWGGTVKRAPDLVQKLNVEWLYRLVRQPSRFKRQLALPKFAWQVIRRGNTSDN
ncbi:glycosyl transferase [Alicyclobacillus ferrooxydans]|uniref:Glycosyl transferase n=2 Tax=Alicyclobacillus ferrooxydans TaxID=471514 RepID=A0A0P9CC06_9BACL|nr:glycosyl transferase [Alicyclobacillus ferrooxydans]